MFICMLLSCHQQQESNQRNAAQGREALKNRQDYCHFMVFANADFTRSALAKSVQPPLRNPLSSARLRRALGGEMLIDIEILIVEVDLIGGARGCGQTGFALRLMCIFLSGIALLLVRSVFKVFAKLFSKKLAAGGTHPHL